MLTAFGIVAMLRMPSGIYPEVAFPRIVVITQTPGLAVKDVEVAVTRPIEEAVSIVLGVVRVRSKSVRGAAQLDIDFAPGTDMIQALNDVRARMAEVGSQLPPGTSSIIERQTPSVFPIISFVVTGGRDPSELHDYAYYDLRPRISRIPDVSYVTVQGGDVREIIVEVEPPGAGRRPTSRSPTWPIAWTRSTGSRPSAGSIARRCNTRCSPTARRPSPLDLEDVVIAEKNGQPIRLRDIGRVTLGHEDRTMVDPLGRQKRGGPDRLSPPGRQRAGRLAARWKTCWPTRPNRPRPASRSNRSTTRACWSARRSPTCATRSSSAAA